MTNVDPARWQFAFVTINHFFFVPVTVGPGVLDRAAADGLVSQRAG
jgi:cytochrome bd-type quinol oxidase subunit 1